MDVLEQTEINLRGGAKSEGGTLENGINKISRKNWAKEGIPDIVSKDKNKDDDDLPPGSTSGGSQGGNMVPIVPVNPTMPEFYIPDIPFFEPFFAF